MFKNCPKCNIEHSNKGIYCCRSCANSRTFTEESKRKKSNSNKKFYDSLTDEKKTLILAKLEKTRLDRQGKQLDKLLTEDFDNLTYQNKRKRVIIEQDFRCGCCNIDEWLDTPITFELEHIDGNRKNNSRYNLVGLCPNCHSLSFSWRGRKNIADDSTRSERFKKYIKLLKQDTPL
jgi:hypothetical protein